MMYLPKETKDLYIENYTTLVKETHSEGIKELVKVKVGQ